MSYADMNSQYRNVTERGRYEMAIREQALIYAGDADPGSAALGQGVIGGSMQDIDAVIGAIVTGPNSASLSEDGSLLAAVQSVWATVGDARYPDAAA